MQLCALLHVLVASANALRCTLQAEEPEQLMHTVTFAALGADACRLRSTPLGAWSGVHRRTRALPTATRCRRTRSAGGGWSGGPRTAAQRLSCLGWTGVPLPVVTCNVATPSAVCKSSAFLATLCKGLARRYMDYKMVPMQYGLD